MIKERVLHIHYDDTDLNFDDENQIHDFYLALGRVAAFALRNDSKGSVDYMSVVVAKNRDLVCGYHEPVEDLKGLETKYNLWRSLEGLQQGAPYIMHATVQQSEGYSFSGA